MRRVKITGPFFLHGIVPDEWMTTKETEGRWREEEGRGWVGGRFCKKIHVFFPPLKMWLNSKRKSCDDLQQCNKSTRDFNVFLYVNFNFNLKLIRSIWTDFAPMKQLLVSFASATSQRKTSIYFNLNLKLIRSEMFRFEWTWQVNTRL